MNHVFLVDGSGYIFRAFHALPPLVRADGVQVNAVLGFCKMLVRLVESTDADHLAVIFDATRRSFRHDISPDYKANRPPTPPALAPQFPLIREATRAFGVPAVEMPGYEADDLIATYAELAASQGAQVTIVSSDKDLMQLVRDRVTIYDPMKNRMIGDAEVVEKFGVGPDRVIDVQALAGDSSDHVPGIAGIGIKTAAGLIRTYDDLDTLLASAAEIKRPKLRDALIKGADAARLSRQLVTLRRDVPVERPLSDFARRGPDYDLLPGFLIANGFRELYASLCGEDVPAKVEEAGGVIRSIDNPVPGFFKVRTVKGGPWRAARIGCDGGAWSASIDGEVIAEPSADPLRAGVFRIWHSGRTLSEVDYLLLLRRAEWAKQHSPGDPVATPNQPINLLTAPLP